MHKTNNNENEEWPISFMNETHHHSHGHLVTQCKENYIGAIQRFFFIFCSFGIPIKYFNKCARNLFSNKKMHLFFK